MAEVQVIGSEYDVIYSEDKDYFTKEINIRLKNSWELKGGVQVILITTKSMFPRIGFGQALTRKILKYER